MSDEYRVLIEEARVNHRQSPSGGEWCFFCRADWPCHAIRLADALERAAGETEQWASIAEQNQALLTTAIEKLAQAERERDELRAAIDGAWATTSAALASQEGEP